MDYPVDALYARQSVDKKDSISIESQLDFCRYETRGEECEVYTDKGYSGGNTNRPDFLRMMDDIKAGKIKRVIVYKLDRISRSILDFANMIEIFQKYSVEFVSSTEKFDTSTPIGRAMLNICIVFAQLERETIQKRVTDAYYSRSLKGYYMGGRVAFGFQLANTTLNGIRTSMYVPDPNEIDQVKFIFKLYAETDMTLGAVMRKLIETGYEKKGAPWSTARLSEVIRNPAYVKANIDIYNFFISQGANVINPAADFVGTNGLFLYKGKNKDLKKLVDLVDRDVVIAPHAGVIEPDVWLRCRYKIMNNRQSARTCCGKRSWLTGKVKCAKCGYAYQVIYAKTKAGRYFQCSGARYAIKCKGAGHTIYADVFENYILQEMKKELAKLEYLSGGKKRAISPQNERTKIRIAEVEKEIESLLQKVPEANSVLMDYINSKVAALDTELKELRKKAEFTATQGPTETERLTNFVEKFEALSLDDKQRVADIMVNVIRVGEDNIEIEWNV